MFRAFYCMTLRLNPHSPSHRICFITYNRPIRSTDEVVSRVLLELAPRFFCIPPGRLGPGSWVLAQAQLHASCTRMCARVSLTLGGNLRWRGRDAEWRRGQSHAQDNRQIAYMCTCRAIQVDYDTLQVTLKNMCTPQGLISIHKN